MKALFHVEYLADGVVRIDATVDGRVVHHRIEKLPEEVEKIVAFFCDGVPTYAWHAEGSACAMCDKRKQN